MMDARTAMQRAASLMQLPSLVAGLGVGMEEVLAGTGVTPDQLRPDAFIPYSAFLAILDNACRVTGRTDIGMELGQRQTLAALGPLGDAMRHAATLGEAIAAFAAFQIGNSTGGAVYLIRTEQDVILGYGVYDQSVNASAQIYDMVLAVGCNLLAELTRGAVGPAEILLSRAAPGDPLPYQRIGRCPVRFGQAQTGLLLTSSSLAFRLPEADTNLHDKARARLASALEESRRDLSGHVRHLLRPLLLAGHGSMVDVAGRLSLHPRTLRRRLREEGTSFEALKDEVRYAAARELLMLGALDVADIALTLDYASISSFVHAFRRWSGMPPGRWRLHGADAAAGRLSRREGGAGADVALPPRT
jgi:AraC-like DNA-binding protein